MKIVELTRQLTDNRIILNFDLPDEYKNQKVKILILPYNDILPLQTSESDDNDNIDKKLWFMDLLSNHIDDSTFSREDMYDEFGR
jgi:hypothetical protein